MHPGMFASSIRLTAWSSNPWYCSMGNFSYADKLVTDVKLFRLFAFLWKQKLKIDHFVNFPALMIELK